MTNDEILGKAREAGLLIGYVNGEVTCTATKSMPREEFAALARHLRGEGFSSYMKAHRERVVEEFQEAVALECGLDVFGPAIYEGVCVRANDQDCDTCIHKTGVCATLEKKTVRELCDEDYDKCFGNRPR